MTTAPKKKSPVPASQRAGQAESVHMDLYDQPGHLLRRAHQIALGMFAEHVGDKLTPREYAVLRMVHERPGIDQVALAGLIGVDTSSTALTAAKLEERGLVRREKSTEDRRLLALKITPRGARLLETTVSDVHRMRQQLLGSLPEGQRELFIELLRSFVLANNEESRAPIRTSKPGSRAR